MQSAVMDPTVTLIVLAPLPSTTFERKSSGFVGPDTWTSWQLGDGNVIGSGNTVNVRKTTAVTEGATLPKFTALLAQLRAGLLTSNFDGKVCKVLLADVAAIEAEAQDAKPSLPIIETKLKSIETITKSAESIDLAVGKLSPLITQAIEFAQHLFP